MSSSFDEGGGRQPKTRLRGGNRARWLIVALLAAVAIGVGAWVLTRGHGEATIAQAPPVKPTPPEPPAPPPEPVPPREQTDPEVRQAITQLCSAPGLARLLGTDDLVRRIVTAVDNVSRGELADEPVAVARPVGPVRGDPQGQAARGRPPQLPALEPGDGRGRRRRHAELRRHVRQDVAALHEGLRRGIGPRGRTFNAALAQAIKRLTAVPVPRGDIVVEQHITYRYADPAPRGPPACREAAPAPRAEEHAARPAEAEGARDGAQAARGLIGMSVACSRPGRRATRAVVILESPPAPHARATTPALARRRRGAT